MSTAIIQARERLRHKRERGHSELFAAMWLLDVISYHETSSLHLSFSPSPPKCSNRICTILLPHSISRWCSCLWERLTLRRPQKTDKTSRLGCLYMFRSEIFVTSSRVSKQRHNLPLHCEPGIA